MRTVYLAFIAILCTQTVAARAQHEIAVEENIAYGIGGVKEIETLYLDMARPKDAKGPLPCVIFIHGGGWAHGNRKDMATPMKDMAKAGYVTATVSYRLAPRHPYPAAVLDCQSAVRFLRANAEQFGIDANKMAAVGYSAGAHLAMMLGCGDNVGENAWDGSYQGWSSKVQAVVSYVGPTDLTQKFPDASEAIVTGFIGASRDREAKLYQSASPISHVDAGDAPMLLFQGTRDELVPFEQAILMSRALDKAGVKGRVELLMGLDHGLNDAAGSARKEFPRTQKAMQEFLAGVFE